MLQEQASVEGRGAKFNEHEIEAAANYLQPH